MDVLLFLLFLVFPPLTKTCVAVELCPLLRRASKIAMHRQPIADEPWMNR